jgi:hypothetical protein
MNKQTFETLQEMIAVGLSEAAIAEHGRPLTSYTLTVGTERIGDGVDGGMVVLTVAPAGFEYKAQDFAIDNNTLITRDQIEARKTYLVNEANALRDAKPAQGAPTGIVATPMAEGGAQ